MWAGAGMGAGGSGVRVAESLCSSDGEGVIVSLVVMVSFVLSFGVGSPKWRVTPAPEERGPLSRRDPRAGGTAKAEVRDRVSGLPEGAGRAKPVPDSGREDERATTIDSERR